MHNPKLNRLCREICDLGGVPYGRCADSDEREMEERCE